MNAQTELEKQGYTVLPKGAWLTIDSNMMHWSEWYDVCKDFGVDTNCTEIILAVAGVKEIQKVKEQ